ncbi:hypothetical protein LTR64_008177 [Lithohypha guttulata]|uniref:uncharacterized protein n=1 Tax=Lithohypha guttulata TaxID=1690604 RepID=UPI002DE11BAA|nr:hypothetical protein LTR51_008329 [Lithohypha guttulata]
MDNQATRIALFLSFVAGTTGMTLLWRDGERQRKVYGLVGELYKAKQRVDAAAARHSQRKVILEPHRVRVEQVAAKTQEMLNFCCRSAEDAADIPELVTRLRHLEKAQGAIETELKVLATTKEVLLTQYNELFDQILRQMQTAAEPCTETSSAVSQITEDLYLPEWLDKLEADGADFDEFMAGGEQVEEEAEDEEGEGDKTNRLKLGFLDLKEKKRQLEESTDASTRQAEIAAHDKEIFELGEQLTLRGIPVRNGEFVRHVEDEESAYAFYNEEPIDEEHWLTDEQIAQPASARAVAGTPSQYVFDWANFEAPEERDYGYNEAPQEWVMEAEAKERQEQIDRDFQEFIFRNNQRVQTWMQTAAAEPEMHIDEHDDDVDESLPVGVEQLPDIEVGECFDMEAELATDNPSKSDVNIRRLQVETLLNQAERKFCSLTQAELESDPDFAVPCDWGEDVEMDY